MKYILKDFMKKDISKYYIVGVALLCLLLIGSYFSYAMFTVSKEKDNAISIITGNLTYELLVDGVEGNTLSIPGNTTKEFTITLNNPNNRTARFNFYYVGSLASNVTAGYKTGNGINTPPDAKGINLEASGTSGSSNTYKIRVSNNTNSSKTITLEVQVGLDYNDLTLPSNGHLFEEYEGIELYKVLLNDNNNQINTSDSKQSFITSTYPYNYIWYSGKLWRAVSIDTTDNSVKVITEENISTIAFNNSSSNFKNSSIQEWLNDESADGFLSNLRDPENFIKMDSEWKQNPDWSVDTTCAVGLLNSYEFTNSYMTAVPYISYLNNNSWWWISTPGSGYGERYVISSSGELYLEIDGNLKSYGVRPVVNIKSSVKVIDGDGTESNPYRLEGDNDSNLSGTKLSSRYSGEYVRFGTGRNNLYRIVSHETDGLTKITSSVPLYKTTNYVSTDKSSYFTLGEGIGYYLNEDFLNPDNGYLTSDDVNLISENSNWYIGTVPAGGSYLLSKYVDTDMSRVVSVSQTAKVGLLRIGELMSGVTEQEYWTLTKPDSYNVYYINTLGNALYKFAYESSGVRPAMNLKSNVVITGGTGTKEDPFEIALQ